MPSSPPNYREFSSGAALTGSVECFWTSTIDGATSATQQSIFPDGCMDILFDFRASTGGRVSVIGTMSRPHIFASAAPVDLFGVRFRPGALPRFVALDAAELTDDQTDLANFWGRRADEIWERLAGANADERARLLQKLLRTRQTAPVDPFVWHCVSRIEMARGDLRIANLESSTGLSARQLERKFSRQLGVSPKTFARIVRFKGVVAAAEACVQQPDWARLANDFGFADQSHLVREFKAFAGLSPTRFMDDSDAAADIADVGFLQDA